MTESAADTFRSPAATAAAYDSHIGRYGPALAEAFVALAGVGSGDRVLDVGCGTGLLAARLAEVVGSADFVAAVDPSVAFVSACRERVPAADVRMAVAEELPFSDGSFDAVLSQLVVNFMTDAPAGVAEMRRVARDGGVVAACVWDYGREMTLLRAFWDAAVALDEGASGLEERSMPYCSAGELAALWERAGLTSVRTAELRPTVRYDGFDQLWSGFLAGVAPSGAYVASLSDDAREALRVAFFEQLGSPSGSFELSPRAWAVVGLR